MKNKSLWLGLLLSAVSLAPLYAASTAVRTINPATYVAGQPVTVTLVVTPDPAVKAYALEETPPNGWPATPTDVNFGTVSAAGIVKWGVFKGTETQTLTFSYTTTPPTGTTGTKVFSGLVSFDGVSSTLTGTTSLTRVNVLPVAMAITTTTAEDTNRVITFTATDADGDNLTYSTVTWPTHGTLTGTGANRTYAPAANFHGTDSFNYRAHDGTGNSPTVTVSITINSVNDIPTAISQSTTTLEDTVKALTLTATDVDGDTLIYSTITAPAHGTLSGTAPALTFTPAANYSGTDKFTFRVYDGTANSNIATATITITAVNDTPTVANQSVTTNEDIAVSIPFSGTDVESASLTYSIVAAPAHGTLSGTGVSRTYTPAAAYSGADSFTYRAYDGTAYSTFNATVSIVVLPINDIPTISNIQNQSTQENIATSAIMFTINDVETAAGSLTVSGTSDNTALVPSASIVFGGSDANRTVTITPALNQIGQSIITVTVDDGTATASDTFVLSVGATNSNPTISPVANQTINEDTNTGAISFTVGDVETAAGSLTLSAISNNAALVRNANILFGGSGANRTVTVTPVANQSGQAVITLSVSDDISSVQTNFTLIVTAVNDAPIISAILDRTILEDTNTGPISFTVSDAETAAGSLTVSANSDNSTLVPNTNIQFGGGANRTVTVTPVANQSGQAVITLTVSDGILTSQTSFTLTVTAVNESPTISAISNMTIDEDTNTGSISFTLTDRETAAGSLAVSAISSNIALVPNANILFGGSDADRTVAVTPAANQSGQATVTLTVTDGIASVQTTFTLTVTAVNDTPTIQAIANRTILMNTNTGAIGFTVSDLETAAGSLTVSGASNKTSLVPNANIALGGSGANRTVTITPLANQSGEATITLTLDDGTSSAQTSFTLTVTAVNTSPIIAAITDRTILENSSTGMINFTVSDEETASGSLTVSANSNNTALVPNANILIGGSDGNRTLTVIPLANQAGEVTITLTVNDGISTAQTSFKLTVTPVNAETPPAEESDFLSFKNVFNPLKEPPLAITYKSADMQPLTIYDRQGRKVTVLTEVRDLGNGTFVTEWDGRNKEKVVVPGFYVVMYTQKGTVHKKKIVVIK